MSRYYKCPLEATFMAKNHRVKFKHEYFEQPCGIRLGYSYFGDFNYLDYIREDSSKAQQNEPPFIVHPDSESIYEPVEGDKNINGFVFREYNNTWESSRCISKGEYGGGKDAFPVSERNNKPFFSGVVE